MAYGKKGGLRMINSNPWTRESGVDRTQSVNRKARLNLSSILTGRRKEPKQSPSSMGLPNKTNYREPANESLVENRGGERRAPFLSNTGPGKKKGY